MGPLLLLACLMLNHAAAAATDVTVRLPSGPKGANRFGAYQTLLAFTPEWDAPWRLGPRSDVVVTFADTPTRLVFWHGANYVPCWVNGNGIWYSDGAVLRPGAGPHNDRLCRFSFATVVESNDARVVVRWRYAPADDNGGLINADPVTRWNDWVDEYYTIYPDATGVRSVTLHSSNWNQPYWVQESMLIRHPGEGETPEAVACASNSRDDGQPEWLDCKGGKPFHAVANPVGMADLPATWGDWPARGASPKAGHEFVRSLQWKPCAETPTSRTWRMLVGMTSADDADIIAISQSWLHAPTFTLDGGECTAAGYQPDEKAYLLNATRPGDPVVVRLTLAGGTASPVVNPAFVFKGWGRSAVSLSVDGRKIPPGADFRCGYRKTATGADLIAWVRVSATKPVAFEFLTATGGGE